LVLYAKEPNSKMSLPKFLRILPAILFYLSCRPAHRGRKHRPPACNRSMLSALISSSSLALPFPDYRTRWRWLPNQRLRSTPGTAALYSNIAFDFLSDALEAATHKQYAALLAERTLNPLHMQHTTFFPSEEQCSHLLLSAHDEGTCTVTEATAGSSGLYSTATDMAIWVQYLLGTGGAGTLSLHPDAQAVNIVPSHLVHQKGLDHAGEPTGIGLGWIHILPVDSPSHTIEKTGCGAAFETYIAINHSRRTAIFLAATDGSVDTHLNVFNAANKLLLALAGLPPLPPPPPKLTRKRSHPHRHQ
jgi:serine-type D-Ala-D-Ala carboxypeptidase/endopeptidase